MQKIKRKNSRAGLTLTEVMVVMVVVAVLAAVAIPSMVGFIRHGQQVNRMNVARTLYVAMQGQLTRAVSEGNLRAVLTEGFYVRNDAGELERQGDYFRLRPDEDTNLHWGRVRDRLTGSFPAGSEDYANRDYVFFISKPAGFPRSNNDTPVDKFFDLLDEVIIDKEILDGAILMEFNIRTGVIMSIFYGDDERLWALPGSRANNRPLRHFVYYTELNDNINNIFGGRGMEGVNAYQYARLRRQGYFGVTYTGVVPDLPIDDIVRIFDGMDYYLNVGTPTVPDIRTNILYAEFLLLNALTSADDAPTGRSLVIYDDNNGAELNGLRIVNPFAQSQQNLNNFNGALTHSQTPGPDGIVNHALYLDTVNTIPIIHFGINVAGVFHRYIWVLDYIEGNTFNQPNNISVNDRDGAFDDRPANLRARVRTAGGATTDSFMFANSHFAADLANGMFQITSARHLNNVRYFPDRSFLQTEHIDVRTLAVASPLGEPTWNFMPIGLRPYGLNSMRADPFIGTYNAVRGTDSQWRIENLVIDINALPTNFAPVPGNVGLFSEIGDIPEDGTVAEEGTVVGVSVYGGRINGQRANNVGAIAGVLHSGGTIARSNSFSNVTGGVGNTGGLVGRIDPGGTLAYSFNAGFFNTHESTATRNEAGNFGGIGSVSAGLAPGGGAVGDSVNIGGLVGSNAGAIRMSFNNARVNILNVRVDTEDPRLLSRDPVVPTPISNPALTFLGGIAGKNVFSITGENVFNGTITNTYATNFVAIYTSDNSGGIVGRNVTPNPNSITHSYFIANGASGVGAVSKEYLMRYVVFNSAFEVYDDFQEAYLAEPIEPGRNLYTYYPYPILDNNRPFFDIDDLSRQWGWEDIEDSRPGVRLVYFELYSDGNYGVWPSVNLTGLTGLRPLGDDLPIREAGYMLIATTETYTQPVAATPPSARLYVRSGNIPENTQWAPADLLSASFFPATPGLATAEEGYYVWYAKLSLSALEERLGTTPAERNIPLSFVVTSSAEDLIEDSGYFHPFFAKAISDTSDFTRAVSEISEIDEDDDDEIRTYQIRTPWQMQNIDKVSTGTPFISGEPDSEGVVEINGLFYNQYNITINPAVNIRVTPTLPGIGVLDPVVEAYLSATDRGWVFPPSGGNAIPPSHNPATYANMGVIGNPHTWAIVDYLGSAVARVIPNVPSTRVDEIRTASLLGTRLTVTPSAPTTISADGSRNVTVTGGTFTGPLTQVGCIFINNDIRGSVTLVGDFTGINIHNTNWTGFTLGAPGAPFSTGTGAVPVTQTNIFSITPLNIHLANNSVIRNARISSEQSIIFGPETVSSGVVLDALFYAAGDITGHINVSGWNVNTLPQFYASLGDWFGINLTMTGSPIMSGLFFTPGTIILNLPVGTGPGTDPVPAVSTLQFLQDRNISIRYDRGLGNTAGDGTTATISDIGGIITLTENAVVAEVFCGIYDGQGHIIEHLVINQPTLPPTLPRYGLFAENHGTIGRLQLRNSSFTGSSNVGSIAGKNSGDILRTAVEFSTVSGGSETVNTIGGIAGTNTEAGRIEDVYFLSTAEPNTPPVANHGGGIVGSNDGEINKVLYLAAAPRTGNEMFPIVRSGTGVPIGQYATSFFLSGYRHSLNQGINWINENYNLSSTNLFGGRPLITNFIDLEWLNFQYNANFTHEFWHQPARGYPYPVLRGLSIPTQWPEADSPVRPDQVNRRPFGTYLPPFGSLTEPSMFRPTVNRAGNVGFINSNFDMPLMNPENPAKILGINEGGVPTRGNWAERIPPRIFRPNNPANFNPLDQAAIEAQFGFGFAYFDFRWVQGWNTRPVNPVDYAVPLWPAIELQRPHLDGWFGRTTTDFQGGDGIFAELNAEVPGTLFQICPTVPGTQVYYSFYHARRNRGGDVEVAGVGGVQRMNFYLSGMINVDGEWVYSDSYGNPLPYPYNRPTIIRPCITPRGTARNQATTRNTVVYGTTANNANEEPINVVPVEFYDPVLGGTRTAYLIDIWVAETTGAIAPIGSSNLIGGHGITFWYGCITEDYTPITPVIDTVTTPIPASPLAPRRTQIPQGGVRNITVGRSSGSSPFLLPEHLLHAAQNNIIGYWDVRRFDNGMGGSGSTGALFSEWKQYYGLFTIPEGQYTTEFAFESGSMVDQDSGNYLSGVTFRSPGFLSIDKYVTLRGEEVMFVQPTRVDPNTGAWIDPLTIELAVKNWGEVAVNNIVIEDQLAPYDAYIEFLPNTVAVQRVGGAEITDLTITPPSPNNRQTLTIALPQDTTLRMNEELLITFNIRVRDNVLPGVPTLLYYFRNEAVITWFDAEHRGYSFDNTLPYNNIPLGRRDQNREVNVSGPEPVQVFIDPIHMDKTISAYGYPPFEEGSRPGNQPFDVTLSVRNATEPRLPITTRGIITIVIPAGFDIIDYSRLPPNHVITINLDGSRRITIPNVNLTPGMPYATFTYRLQYTGQGFGVIATSISSEYRYIYDDPNDPLGMGLSVMMRFPQRVVTVAPTTTPDNFDACTEHVQTFNILGNDSLSQLYADENYDIRIDVDLFSLADPPVPAQVNANGDLQITDTDRGIVIILLASTNEIVFDPLMLNNDPSESAVPGSFEFFYQVRVTATRPGSETFILRSDMTQVTIDVLDGSARSFSIHIDDLETDEFDGDLSDTSHDGDEPGYGEVNGETIENGNNNNGDSPAPGGDGSGDDPASAPTLDGEDSETTENGSDTSGDSHDGIDGGDILIATSFALGGGYGISRVNRVKTLKRKLDARAVRKINEHNERRRMRGRGEGDAP